MIVKSPVRIKKNLPVELYGSYTSLNPAYAVMIKYSKKNSMEQRLIGMPIYMLAQEKKNPDMKIEYVKKILNLQAKDHVEIVSKPLPFYSLLDWNGQLCYLTGASDKVEVCNAKEFHFSKEFMMRHKDSLHRLFHQKKKSVDDETYECHLTDIIEYIVKKIEQKYQLYQNLVSELKKMIQFSDLSLLSRSQKEKVIIELLSLLKCNSGTANFKFLNAKYSSTFGRKNNRIISNTTVITKSVTGIKVNMYEL